MLFRRYGGMGSRLNKKDFVEVDGLAGLIKHLSETHPGFGPPFDASEIEIVGDYGDDDRIGWKDVHIIKLGVWGVVGFTNGKPV